MIRKLAIFLLGVLPWLVPVYAAEPPRGYLTLANETAVESGGEVAKFRNLVEPELDWDLTPNLRLNGAARLLWDPAFDGWEHEASLRELSLDWRAEETDVRLGLQQVVWGQASGFLSGFDVFHPRDLREFVLPSFDFLRRPLWLVQAQQPLGDWTLEALWSPQERVDKVAGPGEPFYTPRYQPPGYAIIDGGRDIEHQRFGVRLSTHRGSWDVAFIYLYAPRSDAVFQRELVTTGVLREVERHAAFHTAGLVFARAAGAAVWRGELSAYAGREYQTTEAVGGVQRTNQVNAVLGLDLTLLTDLDLTLEVGHRHIVDHDASFVEPQDRTTLLVQVRKPFLHETLIPSLAVIHNFLDGDALWRPAIQWRVTDRFDIAAGFDLFSGPANSPFGRFQDRDRAYVTLTYRR